jgi:TRAP-type C4-dicarboxylate transport system substrate-binding protein
MSSGSTGYDSKTYESIKYWYDTQAWLPKNAMLVNQKAFDALDKPTQDGRAQGRRRCRKARLEAASEEKNDEVQEAADRKGHEDHQARAQAGWPT